MNMLPFPFEIMGTPERVSVHSSTSPLPREGVDHFLLQAIHTRNIGEAQKSWVMLRHQRSSPMRCVFSGDPSLSFLRADSFGTFMMSSIITAIDSNHQVVPNENNARLQAPQESGIGLKTKLKVASSRNGESFTHLPTYAVGSRRHSRPAGRYPMRVSLRP